MIQAFYRHCWRFSQSNNSFSKSNIYQTLLVRLSQRCVGLSCHGFSSMPCEPATDSGDSPQPQVILPTPVKGKSDKKEYRSLQLSNGLRVLLICDSARHGPPAEPAVASDDDDDIDDEEDEENDSEEGDDSEEEVSDEESGSEEEGDSCPAGEDSHEYKAAASLAISWGSLEDPTELPGLMHFLEHMVFMGSKKYPSENSFDEFVTRHGGGDNAYTEFEHTNFHFDIHEPYFWEGMDRFSQFFISPLMKKNAMDRERKAVDSEFTMALPNDENREQQLLSSLAPSGHPIGAFSWGSADSLSGKPDDYVHRTLHQFREKYYSAQYMTLAVQSRYSLDEMQDKVNQIFSKVPNNGLPQPNHDQYPFPFPPAAINKKIEMEPMKAKHVVTASWFLPSMKGRYKTQPLRFIAHLLGHEGVGSILSHYKNKDWAYSLECESEQGEFQDGCFYSQVQVIIELSESGYEALDEVLLVLFQYMALLQSEPPSEAMFREYQQLSKLTFDYETESEPIMNVEDLSADMLEYTSEDYLCGGTLLFEYDPNFIKETLDRLTPDTVNLIVRSKHLKFSGSDHSTEKWFGTKYRIIEITEAQKELFASSGVTPNQELHLPHPNVYIPDDFSLLPVPECKPKYPSLISSKIDLGSLYHQPDYKFELPIVYIKVQFNLENKPSRLTDGFLSAMSLFLQCYRYQLAEPLYEATLAKYSYDIKYSDQGLVLHLSGFHQHIERVLNKLMDYLLNFKSNFDLEQFNTMKNLEFQKVYNTTCKPDQLCKEVRLNVLLPQYKLSLRLLNILENVTFDDVMTEASTLFENCGVNMLIQGNISEEAALSLYSGVTKRIACTKSNAELLKLPGYRILPSGTTVMRVHSINSANGNSAIVNYYQGTVGTLRNQVLADFIMCAMEEKCFDILRTKEQLSYSVYCLANESNGVCGLSVCLSPQAEKFSLNHVDTRVEEFLEWFLKGFQELDDKAFDTLKETVLQTKKINDLNLGDEVSRNWNEIARNEFIFDRLQKHIDIIDSVTLPEVVDYLQSFVNSSSSDYRKLSVQIQGCKEHKTCEAPDMKQLISDGCSALRFIEKDSDSDKKRGSKAIFVSQREQFIKGLKVMPHQPIVNP